VRPIPNFISVTCASEISFGPGRWTLHFRPRRSTALLLFKRDVHFLSPPSLLPSSLSGAPDSVAVFSHILCILKRSLESVCVCYHVSSFFSEPRSQTILTWDLISQETSSPISVKLCRGPATPLHNRGSPFKTRSRGPPVSDSFFPPPTIFAQSTYCNSTTLLPKSGL
jgi:hypothetical protein